MKVFVYGTLRKGEANAKLLSGARCMAEQCWTKGTLYDTGFGYPAMQQSASNMVFGELYEVNEMELTQLDQLEGYLEGGKNNLYERVEQVVYTDKGETMAYLYRAGREGLLKNKIQNGDWKEYRLSAIREGSLLYFAYGSCMDQKRFQEDGFAHYFNEIVGTAVLLNYSLRFTRKSTLDGMGRADIVEEGGRVEGKVYSIPVSALKEYLYHREGVPFAYRPTFVTLDLDGKKVQAITFVVNNKSEETAPPERYKEEILRGAEGYVSDAYLSELKHHLNLLEKSI